MRESLNLLSGKRMYLYGLILFLSTSLIAIAYNVAGSDDFDIARREILLRRIGHELLLQSGDSTSSVLPVKKISENQYRISFEKEFSFEPGSLVSTTRRVLAKDPLARDYVVNVLKPGTSGSTYGFAISGNKKDDIITCQGRKQPKARYKIDVKFDQVGFNTARNGYLLGSLPILGFVGFIFLRSVKPRKTVPQNRNTDVLPIGSMFFDARNRKLMINGRPINLTGTESRVLHIFALSPNEVIERNRLQKEIWEDEGVIVGRSLDMFISKLRKKLENDPTVRLVNIHSKGYRLEIED